MKLLALGINHNSATLDVRERVAFAPEQVSEALVDACSQIGLREVVILSTCNRTELFLSAEGESAHIAERALAWLATYHHLSVADLQGLGYSFSADAALQHMMQVASGLDSMVLGEPQILGQMKSAYAVAQEAGTVGSHLGRVFPQIFSVAKRVRTDTAIGENPVSVAYAAVKLAGHIFSDLRETQALLVGAGETIELVARHLFEAGVKKIVIANRTLGRARELAEQLGVEAVLLSEIPEQLPYADIVISSTASQLPILGKGAVEHALKLRKHRPMLMIDIAVPRDIEPQVGELPDVYLYSVDDLREIVDENMRSRRQEARKADVIIAEGVKNFALDSRALEAVDTVVAYRKQAELLRDAELLRAVKQLEKGDEPQAVLRALARGLTNKLIHRPSSELKRASAEGREEVLQVAKVILGLNPEADKKDS